PRHRRLFPRKSHLLPPSNAIKIALAAQHSSRVSADALSFAFFLFSVALPLASAKACSARSLFLLTLRISDGVAVEARCRPRLPQLGLGSRRLSWPVAARCFSSFFHHFHFNIHSP